MANKVYRIDDDLKWLQTYFWNQAPHVPWKRSKDDQRLIFERLCEHVRENIVMLFASDAARPTPTVSQTALLHHLLSEFFETPATFVEFTRLVKERHDREKHEKKDTECKMLQTMMSVAKDSVAATPKTTTTTIDQRIPRQSQGQTIYLNPAKGCVEDKEGRFLGILAGNWPSGIPSWEEDHDDRS